MFNYQIIIEYLGTNYVGWQIQNNGVSIQSIIQKTLNRVLKDCNIEVKKIISHQYSSKFAQKRDISPCAAGKRVIDGINPLEVITHRLYSKKLGLFEKMFNFFG